MWGNGYALATEVQPVEVEHCAHTSRSSIPAVNPRFPHVPQHAAALFDGKNSDGEGENCITYKMKMNGYFNLPTYEMHWAEQFGVRIHLPS